MLLATAAAVAVAGGCVQRRMTIRSNVPGAQVYVDNYEIGRTPASTDFKYYGKRDVRLVKDGYETLTVQQWVAPPWYQIPGIDFIAENVWPFELRDEKQYTYEMRPQYVVPTTTLLGRAEDLRRSNAAAVATPQVVVPGTSASPPTGGHVVLPPTNPPAVAPSVVVPGTVPPTSTPGPFAPSAMPSTAPSGPAGYPPGYGGTPVPQLP